MVQLCQNHWKTIDGNGSLKKTLTIPSPWKIDHRCGLYWSTKDASVVRLYQKMKNLSLICILHLSLSPPVRLRTVLCGSKGFLFLAWLDPYLACWLVILLSMFLLCFEVKPKKNSFFQCFPYSLSVNFYFFFAWHDPYLTCWVVIVKPCEALSYFLSLVHQWQCSLWSSLALVRSGSGQMNKIHVCWGEKHLQALLRGDSWLRHSCSGQISAPRFHCWCQGLCFFIFHKGSRVFAKYIIYKNGIKCSGWALDGLAMP